ncbi:MAG: phosphoglycerate dehydrogenase [Chlamydiae bacterium]|nr:phosphoglycerate dehydrogenase [Chlamydiota bacterium]MBI3265773.1 phosphoglycerate dehydrogenase [Chlamydiota bacterium]
MKILISDSLSSKGLDILKAESDFQVDVKVGLPEEEICKIIKDYDAIIVRSQTDVSAKIIQEGTRLKVIARAGVGVDNVDVEAATKRGIVVMNTPGGNTISTCEHTFSMMMALSRNIPQANVSVKKGEWDRKKFTGVELCGKTLGVVGLGRIGLEVSKRALAFNMKVIAYDPFISTEKIAKYDIEAVDLDTLYRRADYITVHVPLTRETEKLVSTAAFEKMKKGVRVINCARGGVVDEAALCEFIKSGKVAGAALDVFEEEPPKDCKLLELDRVIATPHLGAATEEAQVNVALEVAHQVIHALKKGVIINSVNAPTLDPEVMKQLGPYLDLGQKLGLLLGQLVSAPMKKVSIRYAGQVADLDVKPITLSVLKGILGRAMQESVNFVNAPFLAKNRGIEVLESKSSVAQDFADLIEVETQTNGKEGPQAYSVEGTLFGMKKDARVVRMNGYHVDAVPSGYLLVLSNEDKPGLVAGVSALLGKNNINIAGMTVGRNVAGGRAVTVMNVDSPIADPLLAELSKVKNVLDVKMVVL